MIGLMSGYTTLDRIRNEMIREKIGVARVKDKMRMTKLRWFCHVKRSVNTPMRRWDAINLLLHRRG